MDDLWVFGYGSLMWRPGFEHVEGVQATIHGWHRSLCVYSHVHRGTCAAPGLVLGLDTGGSCRGMAFRVEASRREAVIAYLREREQVTMVYRELWRPIHLHGGEERVVEALVYAADPGHEQYCAELEREETLRLVRQGHGISGACADYVLNTVAHLEERGIHDASLAWLAARLIEDRVPDTD